jgi:hypothetical protein
MRALAYLPSVICAKCNRPVTDVRGVNLHGQPFAHVVCHGETTNVPFADKIGTEVRVFESPPAG